MYLIFQSSQLKCSGQISSAQNTIEETFDCVFLGNMGMRNFIYLYSQIHSTAQSI